MRPDVLLLTIFILASTLLPSLSQAEDLSLTSPSNETKLGVHVLFDQERLFDLAGNEQDGLSAHIDYVIKAGLKVIRFPGDWRQLQPDEGNIETTYNPYYLDLITNLLRYAKSNNVEVIFMMGQSPCWAVPKNLNCDDPRAIWHPPILAEDYAKAMQFLYRHFKSENVLDAVIGWEVWNEPNVEEFWPVEGTRKRVLEDGSQANVLQELATAKRYTELLNATYSALKEESEDVVVVGGSLAASDYPYLQAMYEAGANFDVLSIHPYTKPDNETGIALGPDRCPDTDPLLPIWCHRKGVEMVRSIMVENGDANKTLWFTEFGWSADSEWGGTKTEERQIEFTQTSLGLIQGWDFVDVAIYYRLFDGQMAADRFGFYDQEGNQKQIMSAFEGSADK